MSIEGYKNIGFYKFVQINLPEILKEEFYVFCKKNRILGTLILSSEGINGMLAGATTSIDSFIKLMEKFDLKKSDFKVSTSEVKPFNRLRIKVKKEIISLGFPEISNPNQNVGTYVEPKDWNSLIEQDDVVLIDTRNYYESSIDTFNKAKLPETKNFKQFPKFINTLDLNKDSKVAMFCTGGIRCEKASSFMLSKGFKEVFHLKGGIIKYLEEVPEKESKWEGECFVFDNRVAIEHNLIQGTYSICNGCGEPIKKEDLESPKYEKGVSCTSCFDNLSGEKIKSSKERQKQIELSKERGEIHLGE